MIAAGFWQKCYKHSFRLWGLPLLSRLLMPLLRRLRPFGSRKSMGDELFPSLGTPIVRAYWHDYLRQCTADIRGRGLEIGTTSNIRRFGGSAIIRADAIDLTAHSPEVTLVADLMTADHLEGSQFDCFVNQFTTHIIHDVPSALYHSIRLLKPGGVLLVNFICVTGVLAHGMDMGTGSRLHQFWWFTPLQVQRLFADLALEPHDYQIKSYGNVFARVAWLMNLPAESLKPRELDTHDPMQPILLCARVMRPANWRAEKPVRVPRWLPEEMAAQ
ncbi:MAG: class I SAM-dependent methyltransferase [Prosthecobacter sp.]